MRPYWHSPEQFIYLEDLITERSCVSFREKRKLAIALPLFSIVGQYFVFYDLVIHSIAIGFIGLTIALYLPLMLPPIIGKIIHFTNFNRIPLVLIIISLCIRAVGDLILAQPSSFLEHIGGSSPQIFTYSFGFSGWFVVVAMLVFVMMIHKSMKQVDPLPSSNTKLFWIPRLKGWLYFCYFRYMCYEFSWQLVKHDV